MNQVREEELMGAYDGQDLPYQNELPTHITLYNNDGRQMTLPGVGTTQDTRGKINQPTLPGEVEYQLFEPSEEQCI